MEMKCVACGINPPKSNKAIQCVSCSIALKKVNQQLATYRHREKVKTGKARKNLSYRGHPTEYAIQKALETLKKADAMIVHDAVDRYLHQVKDDEVSHPGR